MREIFELTALLFNTMVYPARGHMAPWAPSVFAFMGPAGCTDDCEGLPVSPLGPNWEQTQWWFRGTSCTGAAQLPYPAKASLLPAGGSTTFEITCHKAFSSYGVSPTTPGNELDACPSGAGPYHADQAGVIFNASLVAGCALGIYDSTDWTKATMDNIVIFSVQPECVKQKVTSFDVPQNMPPCSGAYCICAWFWLAATGQAKGLENVQNRHPKRSNQL